MECDFCFNPVGEVKNNLCERCKPMTYHEKLEYYKKHDPIHYYELTSDPMLVGTDTGGTGCLPAVIFILILTILLA